MLLTLNSFFRDGNLKCTCKVTNLAVLSKNLLHYFKTKRLTGMLGLVVPHASAEQERKCSKRK